MNILDPLSLPLNQTVLIEASAGTGKTYTMANLYLRLILGVGCEPLNVEQILVVTFTKAATQELRDRIRAKLGQVAMWFAQPNDEVIRKNLNIEQDPFLTQLFTAVQEDLATAQLRLKIAEREMDLAAIFTIDSFCQKMLFQYAFDSGMRFDIDLQTDEDALLERMSEETWRELFYDLSLSESERVRKHLSTPKKTLKLIKNYLSGSIPALLSSQSYIQENLNDFLIRKSEALIEIKQFWLTHRNEISALIWADLTPKTPQSLKRASYKKNLVTAYFEEIDLWAKSNEQNIPQNWKKFTQTSISEKTNEGKSPLSSPLFEQAELLENHFQKHFPTHSEYSALAFQFLTKMREKLYTYKHAHREKSFSDITDFLHQALCNEKGERFAQAIRSQFRFAMIDEFQDTNLAQYEIFQRIFMRNDEKQGFVMIGDPKQSIYKFRNADIFSYLSAAEKVGKSHTYTMAKNWRSAPQIVNDVNRLFDFKNNGNSPFLYEGIQFQNVESHRLDEVLKGENQTNCYLIPEYKMEEAAEYCAYHIQQQLKKAESGTLFLQKEDKKRPITTKDMAILVRGKAEADEIKKALAQRNIRAIYLSARDSVFMSQEASDLYLLLKACLNPYSQRHLLSVLGSALWGLSAAEIFNLKQDEFLWEKYVAHFLHYQKIWQNQGILPMLHSLFLQQDIILRLNQQDNAERRITDLLHLAELLQEAALTHQSEMGLVQWYQQQIADPDGQKEEQKLRLESEQELIKIITIHGSKGLEYPIVWLPFISSPSHPFKEVSGKNKKTPVVYHNEKNERCWAFSPLTDQEKNALNREEFAEDLRLLYVALTRAKHQLNFILPEQFDKKWNTVSYLLCQGEIGIGDNENPKPTETYLSEKQLACHIVKFSASKDDEWKPMEIQADTLYATAFEHNIPLKWQITSFSALHSQHEYLQKGENILYQEAPEKIIRNEKEQDDEPYSVSEADEKRYTPYHFPHSPKVGNVLHQFLEEWDFQSLTSTQIQEKICQPLNLNTEWEEPLQHWLTQISHTPIFEDISLSQINAHQRLNEWQFFLRLRNEEALPQLNSLLKAESRLAPQLPDLQFKQLTGFIKGFVDLIVQVKDKFYIVDYKSNYLGDLPQDYSESNVMKAMGKYRYDLQYLLYTLALHRYLQTRLGEQYQYARHFGGVAYLFLRGMNGEKNKGIYFDKPSENLIHKMDELFD